jgi:thiosulfate reductase cytochrome b subunit
MIGYWATGILIAIFLTSIVMIAVWPVLARAPRFHFLFGFIEVGVGLIFGIIHLLRPNEDIWIFAVVLLAAGAWEFMVGKRYQRR